MTTVSINTKELFTYKDLEKIEFHDESLPAYTFGDYTYQYQPSNFDYFICDQCIVRSAYGEAPISSEDTYDNFRYKSCFPYDIYKKAQALARLRTAWAWGSVRQ